jgi:hypothetical protein
MEDSTAQPQEVAGDSAKPEKLLYHYTDQTGLLGILESKSIWATHVRYLNDASEFTHGLSIAAQCIKAIRINLESNLKGFPDDTSRLNARHKAEDIMLEDISHFLSDLQKVPVYVACFFDDEENEHLLESQGVGDNLGQWRAYSKKSTGFCIGFDKNSLEEHILKRQTEPADLLLFGEKCIYDEEEQGETLEREATKIDVEVADFLKRSLDEFDRSPYPHVIGKTKRQSPDADREMAIGPDREVNVVTLADIFMRESESLWKSISKVAVDIAISVVFMKHPAFRAEREWRIAKIFGPGSTTVSFRPGKSSLIPYIEIPLPIVNESGPSLIRRIIVGPSPEIESAVAAVKMLLTSKGYKVRSSMDDDGIEVVPSKIPYRDW